MFYFLIKMIYRSMAFHEKFHIGIQMIQQRSRSRIPSDIAGSRF